MEQLLKYYEGDLVDFDNIKNDELKDMHTKLETKQKEDKGLTEEKIKPKKV